jgi:hypothetical protein
MFLVMTTSSFNQKQVGLLNCVLHLSGILTLVNIFYVGGLKHPYVIVIQGLIRNNNMLVQILEIWMD